MYKNKAEQDHNEYHWETNFLGEPVIIYQTDVVKEGEVEVFLGKFKNRNNEDLAVVRIEEGCKTPIQLVAEERSRTREISLQGDGYITIRRGGVEIFTHHAIALEDRKFDVTLYPGDIIQLVNTGDEPFYFIEVCNPPFKPGRFVVIEDE